MRDLSSTTYIEHHINEVLGDAALCADARGIAHHSQLPPPGHSMRQSMPVDALLPSELALRLSSLSLCAGRPPESGSRLATRPDVGNRACHSLQHPQPQFNTKPVARTQTQAKAHTCAHRTHPKSTGQVHSRPTDGASGRPRLLPHPSCTPRYRRHATCIVEHLPRLPSKRPLPPLLPPRER